MGEITAAVEVQKLNPAQQTVLALVKQQETGIRDALPAHIGVERFHRIVLTEVRRNPRLLECEPYSLLGGIMLSAQLGLELGPLGQAYLIPFRNRRRNNVEATFIIGYQGMIELARRSGQVASIQAFPVYQNDEFSWQLGLNPDIQHKPAEGDRGVLTHVYATVHYKDGGYNFEVLTKADVEKYRARSRSKNDGPWVTDYEAMALKTAIRRLFRWLPKSPEINQAMTADERSVPAIAPLESTLDSLVMGGSEEISDAETGDAAAAGSDTADEVESPPPVDEDTAWQTISEALAEIPTEGSKPELAARVEELSRLMGAVGLAVPARPDGLTERAAKDTFMQAVTDWWEAARRSYSDGPQGGDG